MDAFSLAINESQWMLCLVQITGLMLIGWTLGRMTLRKFPDVSASIGVVVLAASAGLVVITLAGVPRPFELTTTDETTEVSMHSSSNLPIAAVSNSDALLNARSGRWFNQLASLVNFSSTSVSSTDIADNSRPLIAADRLVGLTILLTILGGLVGIFRVAHSSKTIGMLARSSSLICDERIGSEVARIVAQLPTALRHQDISVHQINGSGSPFICWLTGSRIFVPDTFLDWTTSEQSTSLAHEISHLQRRDHFCRLLTELTFCLVWLHPLAWILHRQTLLAQELAADQLAAQTTENPSAYCRGLSRLALRFDAQSRQPSALGVSVSSSLIRRITMLREITFHRLPCSRLVHRCIALSTFVACAWIACWSVEAQTATPNKVDSKVDSKVVVASHTVPMKMFSQPTTLPWETLGNHSGYVKIQLNRLLEHPELKTHVPIMTAAIDGVLSTENDATSTLKKFGLRLDGIAQIHGTFWVSLQHDPDQPDGQRSRINLGMGSAEITTVNQVDWPGLIKTVDLPTLIGSRLPESYFEKLRKAWLNSATKSRSIVFPEVALDGQPAKEKHAKGTPMITAPKQQPPTESKKALWEAVSGGVATVVYDIIVQFAPQEYKEKDALNQANLELTVATETAAWGLDLSPDYESCRIRFAAVPKPEVSIGELLNKFDAFRDEIAKDLNARIAKDLDVSDDEFEKHLLGQWKKIKVSVVNGKVVNGEKMKDYMLVEGECSGSIIKALNLSEMFTFTE